MGFKAVVRGGHLHLDEPTDPPEGTELMLIVDDESRGMSSDQLAKLNAALERAAASLDRGEGVSGDELLARLEAKSA